MTDLLRFADKCARKVGEEVVEEPANIFGDNIINPSLPKLSEKPATPLFDRQREKHRSTFPSPVAKDSSDNRQLMRLQVHLYLLF